MGARRKGRELAVQALYQIELSGDASATAIAFFWEHAEASAAAKEFGAQLVTGVREHLDALDVLIADACENWRLERISRVDRNVLRVAAYELAHTPNVPPNVVLDEAIEVARRFGTQESAMFVNGILDQIAGRLGVKPEAAARGPGGDG